MYDHWDEPLPAEEREKKLTKIAWEIRRRKLEAPAMFFLESHRPLAFLGGQGAVFFAPFLVPLLGYTNVKEFSQILNQKGSVERLLELIEYPLDQLKPTEPANEQVSLLSPEVLA